METEKKKKNRLKAWVFFYLALLVVLYLLIYAFPSVTGALTPTMVVSYGELKVWDEVTCYLVRQEEVYTAEKGGSVNYYVEEGALVRQGTKVLDVDPASGGAIQAYTSQANGIISYYIDGNESYFTPETMTSLKEEETAERTQDPAQPENTMRKSALAGEPLYKRVDNSLWYAIYWVDQSKIAKYEKNASVTIQLPLGEVEGTISDIVDNGDKWLVILKFDRYYEDMASVRQVKATVVTQDYSGLLIPNESLVTVEKQLGVYVKQIGGQYEFVPVKVITTDGENSLVYDSYFYEQTDEGSKRVSTVEIYDEILKNGKP